MAKSAHLTEGWSEEIVLPVPLSSFVDCYRYHAFVRALVSLLDLSLTNQ